MTRDWKLRFFFFFYSHFSHFHLCQHKKQLRNWISTTIGEPVEGDFQEALKNGIILCKYPLLNVSFTLFPPSHFL